MVKKESGKSKWRVALADDHLIMREAMADSILDCLSDKVTLVGQASDGVEAVELAKKHQPDLMMIDLQMPRMDGIQAAREIRKISPHTFIIALSQLEDHPHIVKALDAGVRDYIFKKDAHMKLLMERIENALTKKSGPYDSAIDRIQVARRYGIPIDRDSFIPNEEGGGLISPQTIQLTDSELKILEYAAYQGLAVKEISQKVKSTPATVQKHLYHIYEKLGAENQSHAVCLAIKYKLIDPDRVEPNFGSK